jgi:hypothetical protein
MAIKQPQPMTTAGVRHVVVNFGSNLAEGIDVVIEIPNGFAGLRNNAFP